MGSNRKTRTYRIDHVTEKKRKNKQDWVVVEEPLSIKLRVQTDPQSHVVAITMRTPGNDYELATGFLYNEGIIQSKAEIATMTYCVGEARDLQEYNDLLVTTRHKQMPELPQLNRHFVTNSSCGVCGSTMVDDLEKQVRPPMGDLRLSKSLIATLPEKLIAGQPMFQQTGGVHGAGLFSASGIPLAIREDVGRHNAVDKLVGWGVLEESLPLFQEGVMVVSGRVSYELVQKTVMTGASILCAVSAPSSLAISTAHRYGITLIGFLRNQTMNIYTHPHRIQSNSLF